MDFEEISMKAFKKQESGKFYKLPEKYAYLQLEKLYDYYIKGKISLDKSIKIKNQIELEFKNNQKEYDRTLDVYKSYIENTRENYTLMCKIEKSNDKEEIFNDLLQIVSNCIGQNNFKERTLNRLDRTEQN